MQINKRLHWLDRFHLNRVADSFARVTGRRMVGMVVLTFDYNGGVYYAAGGESANLSDMPRLLPDLGVVLSRAAEDHIKRNLAHRVGDDPPLHLTEQEDE